MILRAALPRLREDLVPDIDPLLLLVRQDLVRIAEGPRQDVSDPRAEDLEGQHRLPVSNAESHPVGVDGDNAGVHLSRKGSTGCAVSKRSLRTYLELGVAAQQGNGKVVHRVGLERVVVAIATLHDVVV